MSAANIDPPKSALDGDSGENNYRVLLLRTHATELLAQTADQRLRLPCFDVPHGCRVAEVLNAKVSERYGFEALCLFPLEQLGDSLTPEQPFYEVMEIYREHGEVTGDLFWPVNNLLSRSSFVDERDGAALAMALEYLGRAELNTTAEPFGHPGWIHTMLSWVGKEIAHLDLRPTGNLIQRNASPTFALVRIETNSQAVWFKAVGEPNLPEFPISIGLASLFPRWVPDLVASCPAWHAWITTEFPGRTLDECPQHCELAAENLARFQIASSSHAIALLRLGCRDFRTRSLMQLVDPFLSVMGEQMASQAKTTPAPLNTAELNRLGTWIVNALLAWEELGIPDTLGHLDFNPGNILCSDERCIFIDWAEGYVGPAFMTLEYLREHFRRDARIDPGIPATLLRAYDDPWLSILESDVLDRANDLTPLLSVFAYAIGANDWRDRDSMRNSGRAAYFRSLTRRMMREAESLHRGQV